MVHAARASHVGSCLSMMDMLAVLYGAGVIRVDPQRPDDPGRDRFILSKGHAAAALYACLAKVGFFPEEWLESYCQDGAHLGGHATHHGVPGVEFSTGSLGHGLGLGCGVALAGRGAPNPFRAFVMLSDGECDEGSTWEAALFAGHHRLSNLIALVDHNKIQSFGRVEDVLRLEPFADKWRAFGWEVREVDGHDHAGLAATLAQLPFAADKPSVLIGHTVKGKGVSFMEDRLLWHYRSPDAAELGRALRELGFDS